LWKSGRYYHIRRGYQLLLLLLRSCRAVFLAGLASLQDICNDVTTQYGDMGPAPQGAGAGGTGNPNALAQITGQNLNTGGLLNVFGEFIQMVLHNQILLCLLLPDAAQ
jgi:hypothetical protein